MSFVAEDLELKIDLTSRDVSVNGSHIPFTKQESDILIRLANRRRSVISREVLLSSLYVHSVDEPEIKLLDVIICKMRKKLKTAHPEANRFIETVRGRGFKLVSGFITGDSRGMAS
jgi:two-component system cell cycle response regulator CtrA